jgi:hypothetical protein
MIPNVEWLDPRRTKDRRLMVDPRLTKSRTLNDDPNRITP